MSKFHTPGPWTYTDEMRLVSAARDGDAESPTICDVLDTTEGLEGDCPQADANGHLIAAAPDLLAACRAFAKWFDGWCPNQVCCARSGLPIHEAALAAIAKAKGGAA